MMAVLLLVMTGIFLGLKVGEIMLIGDTTLLDAAKLLPHDVKAYWFMEIMVVCNLLWFSKIRMRNRVRIRNYELHHQKPSR